jgi:micrococcal nuclease
MIKPEEYLYHYRAVATSIYDGDSVTADIDLGFGTWIKKQKLRLFGINTPEIRGEERGAGLEARTFVVAKLDLGKPFTIQSYTDKKGKYGRWLAIIFVDGDVLSLNQQLLDRGLAERYEP